MKFLTYLIPAAAVILPALATEECLTTAVSSTQCEATNIDCVCDSAVFLESLFECSIDQAEDEDAIIDEAEAYCGALYKRSDEFSEIEARAKGDHRRSIREAMTAIHKIRGELRKTSGRAARMSLFRKLRRARGRLNRIWNDGKKHKGWGRPMPNPPRPAHPGRPTHTYPGGPTQTVLPPQYGN